MKGAIQKTPRSDELLQALLTHSADLAGIEAVLKLKNTPVMRFPGQGTTTRWNAGQSVLIILTGVPRRLAAPSPLLYRICSAAICRRCSSCF